MESNSITRIKHQKHHGQVLVGVPRHFEQCARTRDDILGDVGLPGRDELNPECCERLTGQLAGASAAHRVI
jgi:hypothetical protein